MIQRWADSTTAVLADAKGFMPDTLAYDKLRYGVYVFLYWLVNTAVLLTIALLLDALVHVLLMYLAYGCLRMVSYGVHLDKAWLCTVASMGCYLLGLVFARRVVLPYPVTLALLGLGLVSFLCYAPAETKKRPLSATLKKRLKPLAICNYVVIATLCAIARTPVVSNLILWAIIIQSFNITPLSFKLFTRGGK